jgi:hypothetical protein
MVVAIFLLFSCHIFTHDDQASGSDVAGKDRVTAMNKVDLEVRKLIDKIGAADTASSNNSVSALSALSTLSVKVDDKGRIQLYVHVSSVDHDTRELLSEAGAEIEVENSELKVYQAWVPADAVRAIAEAGPVQKVTPPSYASYR